MGARLPTLDEVVYGEPNPGGARKSCSNCSLWVGAKQRCLLHGELDVSALMVCGYHVPGKPLARIPSDYQGVPQDPRASGLVLTQRGTACDLCAFFRHGRDPRFGTCVGLSVKGDTDPNHHPKVHTRGCCSRWTPSILADAITAVYELVTRRRK